MNNVFTIVIYYSSTFHVFDTLVQTKFWSKLKTYPFLTAYATYPAALFYSELSHYQISAVLYFEILYSKYFNNVMVKSWQSHFIGYLETFIHGSWQQMTS